MKRTLITSLLASALLFGGGCSDDFDDSALWKGVDEIYNQLTELEKQADQLNDQIRLLSSIVNGGAITSITQDAEGNDVIRGLIFFTKAISSPICFTEKEGRV